MDIFAEVIGQEHALAALKNSLDKDRISHAYLFIGPSGVGKLTTARLFAREIILQQDKEGFAYLRENIHPDLMVVEKYENKTMIGIEQVTGEIEPWLALKPYRAARRVVIIKEAHLLSAAAANALLKTLEEPPEYAVIIMVSDDNNLLETIVSRCQLIRFSPVADTYIKEILQKRGVEDEQRADHLARLGQGSVAAALAFAEQEGIENLWDSAKDLISNLGKSQEMQVFNIAEKIEDNPQLMVNLIEVILRDIFIYQQSNDEKNLLMADNVAMYKSFKKLKPENVKKALLNIERLKKLYRSSVNSLLLSINISYELMDALK